MHKGSAKPGMCYMSSSRAARAHGAARLPVCGHVQQRGQPPDGREGRVARGVWLQRGVQPVGAGEHCGERGGDTVMGSGAGVATWQKRDRGGAEAFAHR